MRLALANESTSANKSGSRRTSIFSVLFCFCFTPTMSDVFGFLQISISPHLTDPTSSDNVGGA